MKTKNAKLLGTASLAFGWIICAGLLTFGLSSCNNDNEPADIVPDYVTFTAGVNTRATGNTWEGTETFGVAYGYQGGTSTLGKKYVISGGAGGTSVSLTAADVSNQMAVPTNTPSASYIYYVHSPYKGTAATYTVYLESQEDLLTAQCVASTTALQKNPVLNFKYLMAKVILNLQADDVAYTNGIEFVEIDPTVNTALFSVTGVFTYPNPTAGNSFNAVAETSIKYTTLMFPTAASINVAIYRGSLGGEVYFTIPSTTYESGKEYTYTVNLSKNVVTATSVTVAARTVGTMTTSSGSYYY